MICLSQEVKVISIRKSLRLIIPSSHENGMGETGALPPPAALYLRENAGQKNSSDYSHGVIWLKVDPLQSDHFILLS